MNMSILVIDFIIFTVAAVLGFIWGALWVDSEFEQDAAYLAAEVENLTEALEALTESYMDSVAEGDKIFDALQRSVDAYEELQKFPQKNGNGISAETQRKIQEAWHQADRDIDL